MALPPPPSSTMIPPRSPSALPQRKNFWARYGLLSVFLLALLAAAAAYYYYNFATIATAEIALAKRGTALTSVYGTVNVEPNEQIIVRTRNFGQLSAWKINVGDTVKKGQPLAEMTDDALQREVDAAKSNLAQSKMHLSLGAPSAAALKDQEIEVEKIRTLVQANNLAQVELDKAQIELSRLKDQVQNELVSLNNDVDSQQRLLDGFQAQLDEMLLTSPIDGVVLNTYVNLGEFIPPQTQVCEIGSAAVHIVANVNEEDVGYLKVGMKAQVRLYAFEGMNLAGTLTSIRPKADNQIYKVNFSLDDTALNILPGMTGEMNVIVGERKNALTIPSRAIRRGDLVLTVVNGIVGETHVTIGFHTIETSEILAGLDEGTPVILSNQDLYKPGMRVRQAIEKAN